MPKGKDGTRVNTQSVIRSRSVAHAKRKRIATPDRPASGGKVTHSYSEQRLDEVLKSIAINLSLVRGEHEFFCFTSDCAKTLDLENEVEVILPDGKARYFCSDEHADEFAVAQLGWQ